MFSSLEVSVSGSVGAIWLNRAEKLNALSITLLRELAQAAAWFDEQHEVRVVTVGGRGRAFCAGADLEGFPEPGSADIRAAADAGRVMADALESMQAITVARIHGWCIGGGLVLAAACDLRIAEQNARFSIPEVELGIPLAWGGIPRLVREIGPALTKELVITCREFDAGEAKAAGFLNRVVPKKSLDGAVSQMVDSIVSKPAVPVNATKLHVDAVTSQMVGIDRAWADADSLIAALHNPECSAARETYIASRLTRK